MICVREWWKRLWDEKYIGVDEIPMAYYNYHLLLGSSPTSREWWIPMWKLDLLHWQSNTPKLHRRRADRETHDFASNSHQPSSWRILQHRSTPSPCVHHLPSNHRWDQTNYLFKHNLETAVDTRDVKKRHFVRRIRRMRISYSCSWLLTL